LRDYSARLVIEVRISPLGSSGVPTGASPEGVRGAEHPTVYFLYIFISFLLILGAL